MRANSFAFALSADNPALVAKARSVSAAVAVNLDAWRASGLRYCLLAFDKQGRDRLVMARDLESVCCGLDAVFAHLEGCACLWVFDEALRSTVEPLALANEMGPAGGHA
jgi:hypothetical protein